METMTTNTHGAMAVPFPVNADIAARFEEAAGILAAQGANPYRVQAYRRAAATVRDSKRAMDEIVRQEGLDGLRALPGIGDSLSRSIHQLVTSGRLPMLDRIRGEHDPVEVLVSVPGIGRKLAQRLHEDLGLDSLEELEAAAHDGRLALVAGFGAKRIIGIRDALASRLGRVRRPAPAAGPEPAISEILDVDREYRVMADRDVLPKIAPRRFNPQHKTWLPVLHTTRGERHYTALFSNTARAHEADMTHDWVIIYADGGQGERQYTVITALRGPLEGRRIVRGRETECVAHYLVAPEGKKQGA
ncbi:MAG: helix-hairpin-helix domain-containing protein [Blastocatellia bacterium]